MVAFAAHYFFNSASLSARLHSAMPISYLLFIRRCCGRLIIRSHQSTATRYYLHRSENWRMWKSGELAEGSCLLWQQVQCTFDHARIHSVTYRYCGGIFSATSSARHPLIAAEAGDEVFLPSCFTASRGDENIKSNRCCAAHVGCNGNAIMKVKYRT